MTEWNEIQKISIRLVLMPCVEVSQTTSTSCTSLGFFSTTEALLLVQKASSSTCRLHCQGFCLRRATSPHSTTVLVMVVHRRVSPRNSFKLNPAELQGQKPDHQPLAHWFLPEGCFKVDDQISLISCCVCRLISYQFAIGDCTRS